MKSIRKSLAFLVVLAMVFSCVAPVMAATPTDVAGTDYEAAVGNLVALGIINGYEDGTFKPEATITRAEFSKIACYLLGMQAAGAQGTATQFKDVPASHWASGYIALAAGKGIIKGYPGGLFKPEENVTYAEAITILVRAIGMGEFVEKQGGTWPSNYMAAGSMAGITSDIAGIGADGKAIRGIIAQLAWNALGAEKWGPKEYTTDGITYGPQDKTLMEELYKNYVFKNSEDKYQIKWFEDIKVTSTYTTGLIEADQIKIDASEDKELAEMLDDDSATALVDVAEGINTIALYGLKIDALFGKDNKIVSLKVATPAKDIVKGFVAEYTDEKLSIKAAPSAAASTGVKYAFADSFVVFINSLPVASPALTTAFGTDSVALAMTKLGYAEDVDGSTANVTAILKGGNIETLKITVCDTFATAGYDTIGTDGLDLTPAMGDPIAQFVVAEITSKNILRNVASDRDDMFDLDDLTSTDKYVILKNGKPAAKSDIKVGDALTIFQKDNFTYILDSDVKVTGKITKNAKDDAARGGDDRRKLTIDGKVYEMALDGSCAYTKNGDIEEEDVEDTVGTLSDFVDKEATLTLNALGDVVFVNGKVSTSSANLQVGVVTRTLQASGDDYSLKILGQDGTTKTYTVVSGDAKVIVDDGDLDASATYEETDLDTIYDDEDITKGHIVLYEVSADSKIKAENLYINGIDAEINDFSVYLDELYVDAATVTDVDNDNKEFTADIADAGDRTTGTTDLEFGTKSTTTFINFDAANIEKVEGWDSLVSDDDDVWGINPSTVNGDVTAGTFFVSDENQNLKSVLVAVTNLIDGTDPDYINTDDMFGVFVESWTDSDDEWVKILYNGAEKDYKVAGDVYEELDEGDLVKFTLNGEGEFDADDATVEVFDQATISELAEDDDADIYKIDTWDSTDKVMTFVEAGNRDDVAGADGIRAYVDASAYVYTSIDGVAKVGSLSSISDDKFVVLADKNDDGKYEVVVVMAE
ncbi:MAG: S-layer homology domain-containing protein [Ignavibacteriales bacterium]